MVNRIIDAFRTLLEKAMTPPFGTSCEPRKWCDWCGIGSSINPCEQCFASEPLDARNANGNGYHG